MAEIGFGFHQIFAEQQAALRLRLGNLVPTWAWDDLRHNQHDHAFVVAGATKADLLADLAGAVDKAVSQGTTLEEFRRDFRRIVAQHGWTGWTGEGTAKGEAWRTRVIYQTNLLTSYAAGRRAQLIAGNYKYWVYRHSGAEHPRLHHLALDGIALPPDHPFWAKYFPPNGWACGCRVFGANTPAGIRRVGGDPDKQLPPDWDKPDPRTGLPAGIQKGWDYAPGESTTQLVAQMMQKAEKMPEPLASAARQFLAARSPDTPRGLTYPTLKPSTDLAEISDMAKAARLAIRTGHTGLHPEGYYDMVRVGIEAAERFSLPPLRYFGVDAEYPYSRVGPADPDILALHHHAMRSISFPATTTDRDLIRSVFGSSASPSPETFVDWQDRLAGVSDEVRRLIEPGHYPGFSVYRTSADIIAHEFGHYAHFHYKGEIDGLLDRYRMDEDGWAFLLSDYATVDRLEFFAEAFTLYLRSDPSEYYRLHPALLEYFLRRDKAAR